MFRFTIRDVLWLTAVVALAVALFVNHSRYRQQIAAMAQHEEHLKRKADLGKTGEVTQKRRADRQ
jgi:hypothetical protein